MGEYSKANGSFMSIYLKCFGILHREYKIYDIQITN